MTYIRTCCCLQNQPANPDPRKFKLPKLLRTCQYELNESKMMDVRNFYHGPVELGEAIFRAAKKDFPCATYYLGLCYMQGALDVVEELWFMFCTAYIAC